MHSCTQFRRCCLNSPVTLSRINADAVGHRPDGDGHGKPQEDPSCHPSGSVPHSGRRRELVATGASHPNAVAWRQKLNRRLHGKTRSAVMLLMLVVAQTHFSALAQCPPPPQTPPAPPTPPVGAQHPTLLQGYALRPSFNVAGVDYAVGVPAGTVLTDWQALSGPGITVRADASPPYVRVDNTSNVVISGVDFSLHGGAYLFFVNSPSPTVMSSKFGGTNLILIPAGVIDADSASPNLTVTHSTMGGGGLAIFGATTPWTESGLINNTGGGTTTLTYNWLKNIPQHVLEENQQTPIHAIVIYRNNLVEQAGWGPGAHLNYLQFSYGAIDSVDVEYNTFYNTPHVASSGESLQFYGVGGYVHNATWAY
ncbi:MAG: hypothetical protein ACREDR_28625, partial [Blastocatellia bacterium]